MAMTLVWQSAYTGGGAFLATEFVYGPAVRLDPFLRLSRKTTG